MYVQNCKLIYEMQTLYDKNHKVSYYLGVVILWSETCNYIKMTISDPSHKQLSDVSHETVDRAGSFGDCLAEALLTS